MYKELQSDNLVETKYQRVGHVDYGRVCDHLVSHCTSLLQGGTLPKRWKYKDPATFLEQFGTGTHWAKTKSYHAYYIEGNCIFRIWTNSGQRYAWVDVLELLGIPLAVSIDVENIPQGSMFKCKPMVYRFKATTVEEIDFLVSLVKEIYGV